MATTQDDVGTRGPEAWLRRLLIAARRARGRWSLLYYVGGAIWVHQIDDDPTFGADTAVPEGASRAVAVAADLIDREVNQHRWVANDPFFLPGYLLDNMPAYQTGIMGALGRFADRAARPGGARARLERRRSRSRERRRPASTIRATSGSSNGRARRCSRARKASTAAAWRICVATISGWRRGRRCSSGGPTICCATLDRISDDLGGSIGGADPGGRPGRHQLPRLQRRQPVLQRQGQALRLLPDPARARAGLTPT